jgi:hypothetical protein
MSDWQASLGTNQRGQHTQHSDGHHPKGKEVDEQMMNRSQQQPRQ